METKLKINSKTLILKGLLGFKSKYTPGGIRVPYAFQELSQFDWVVNPQSLLDYYAYWLDHRRKQLEQNMKDTETYPETSYIDVLKNLRKGYENGRIAINKEIYKQLNNAANTFVVYDSEHAPELDENTSGQTFFDDNNGKRILVKPNMNKQKTNRIILHELSHAANNPLLEEGNYVTNSARSPQEKKIQLFNIKANKSDFLTEEEKIKFPNLVKLLEEFNDYLSEPSEIYARLMEFRYENKLNPSHVYTIDEIRPLVEKSKVSDIKSYKLEDLVKMLNEIAQNTPIQQNNEQQTYYVKQGGLIPKYLFGAILRGAKKLYSLGNKLALSYRKRKTVSKINKELVKGIKENSILESYNAVPANKDIGTVSEYMDFLDNVFPNSKLNSTFHHGGPKGIVKLKSSKELGSTNKGINSGSKDYGIYLADNKRLAEYYATSHKDGHVYNVRVNVQKPMRYETNNAYLDFTKGTQDLRFSPASISLKWYDKLNLKDYDGIYHTASKNPREVGELVMFNGDNIHIMGTPEESQMFRRWKLSPTYSSKPLLEEIPITPVLYDKSLLNYLKASVGGIVLGGLGSILPISLWKLYLIDSENKAKYKKYSKQNAAIKQKHYKNKEQ